MAVVEERLYGNYRRPAKPGLGSLSLTATAVLIGGFLAFILTQALAGLLWALAVGTGVLVVIGLLLFRDRHHRTVAQRLFTRLGWARTTAAGAHLYRSGPLSRIPWGSFQLPGLAAGTSLSEHQDSYGRPFAMLHMPSTDHYTVAVTAEPEGASLVDQAQIDDWVANWGGWLRDIADEPGLVGAQVVVETAAGTGHRLAREVAVHTDPNASPFAQAMLAETVRTYSRTTQDTTVIITMTFAAMTPYGQRRRGPAEMGREIGQRLPALTGALNQCGAGAARPVTAQGLCEAVRVAYDPVAAPVLAAGRSRGEVVPLRWHDVGPVAHETSWSGYHHDSAYSTSWIMSAPPRGESTERVLRPLLAPHPAVDRKRVALLYRPLDSARSSDVADADSRNASSKAAGRRASERAKAAKAGAEATAREEARGAGLVNFGLVVTATVTDAGRRAEAAAVIGKLGATAKVLLRPAHGSQDSAFAAALPLGIVLSEHMATPQELKEVL